MLSQKSIEAYGKFINVGHFLGFLPFSFDMLERCLKSSLGNIRQGYRYKWLKCSILIQLIYQIFLSLRCWQIFKRDDVDSIEKFRTAYMTSCYIGANFNHWITMRYLEDHRKVINSFLDMTNVSTQGKEPKDKVKDENIVVFLRVAIILCVLIPIARASGCFFKPNSGELLTSVASKPETLPVALKGCLSLIHLYITGFLMYFYFLHGFTMFVYISAILPVLQQTRPILEDNEEKVVDKISGVGFRNGSKWSKVNMLEVVADLTRKFNNERSLKTQRNSQDNLSLISIYHCYHKLSVQSSNFSAIYGTWPIGCEINVGIYVTVNLFLAGISTQFRFLLIGVFAGLLIIMFFTRFAQVHAQSKDIIHSWMEISPGIEKDRKWFLKFQKSCRPLRINIGGFFYADKGLVLTMISIILHNAMNLILTFRKA